MGLESQSNAFKMYRLVNYGVKLGIEMINGLLNSFCRDRSVAIGWHTKDPSYSLKRTSVRGNQLDVSEPRGQESFGHIFGHLLTHIQHTHTSMCTRRSGLNKGKKRTEDFSNVISMWRNLCYYRSYS